MPKPKKQVTYSITPQTVLQLKDMATTLEYGSVQSDRRIQVVMPSMVVDLLDQTFQDQDRSKILTQLAIEAVLERIRWGDRPDLAQLVSDEPAQLDQLWRYLADREEGA